MHPFTFVSTATAGEAVQAVAANAQSTFFAGGTTLIDLMKLEVLTPTQLVDVNKLPFSELSLVADGVNTGVDIGANVRNSDLAHHPYIRENFPVLSEALLAGASAQLRNMASTAGNIMQRTRCEYFRNVNSRCNKRQPGSGCDALTGVNRDHAILGTSPACIATHHSDMCVALAMLDTTVHTVRPNGAARAIPFGTLHLLPGETPHLETILEQGELITHIHLASMPMARRSLYLKVRDRGSYEFALASAAVALDLDGSVIRQARVGLGGIATKPWRSREAEFALTGQPASSATFQAAAEAAMAGSVTHEHNAFKVDLAKRTLVAALENLGEKQ